MDGNLSDPQTRILRCIENYMREEGRPPTNREIGQGVQILSTGHVNHHLTMLEKKGYITREPRKSRGIRLTSERRPGLPIAGRIAAGEPLDINDDGSQDTLDLTTHARGYVLLVQGESMIEDQIADGDYVLIEAEADIRDGNIVVAVCKSANGERGAATLKRLYREPGRIRLQPANAKMEPIYVEADEWDRDWEVKGKVAAVYRPC